MDERHGTPHPEDLLLGDLAVRGGFATFQQVHECLEIQKAAAAQTKAVPRLGELMLAKGYLFPDQLQQLLEIQKKRPEKTGVQIPGYEILAPIGRGGMGMVYRAKQLSIGRTVAIKILPPEHAQDRQFVDRFLREIRALSQLQHPNIAAAIDAGQAQGILYYVMEFINGRSLAEILREKGKLSEPEAVRVSLGVARALEHAAAQKILHRDIKPANIMITSHGEVKLCDYGLAKRDVDPSLTSPGISIGTPHYIAPELARGSSDVDIRADLYSLGATLYHMVTGAPPFSGETPADTLAMHVRLAPPPPIEKNPLLSPALNSLILGLLQKDRQQRPTPVALIQALEALATHPDAPRISPPTELRRGKPPSIRLVAGSTRSRPPTSRRTTTRRIVPVAPPLRARRIPVAAPVAIGAAVSLPIFGLVLFLSETAGPPRPIPENRDEVDRIQRDLEREALAKAREEFQQKLSRADLKEALSLFQEAQSRWEAAGSFDAKNCWKDRIDDARSRIEQMAEEQWKPMQSAAEEMVRAKRWREAENAIARFPEHLRTLPDGRRTKAGAEFELLKKAVEQGISDAMAAVRQSVQELSAHGMFDQALDAADRMADLLPSRKGSEETLRAFRKEVLGIIKSRISIPPFPPEFPVAGPRELARLFSRYGNDAEISREIEVAAGEFAEIYARERARSAAALEDLFTKTLAREIHGYFTRRNYPKIRARLASIFTGPDSTALRMKSLDDRWFLKLLNSPSPVGPAEIGAISQRLAEARNAARAAGREYRALANLIETFRNVALLESYYVRAAHAFQQMGPHLPREIKETESLLSSEIKAIEPTKADGAWIGVDAVFRTLNYRRSFLFAPIPEKDRISDATLRRIVELAPGYDPKDPILREQLALVIAYRPS